MGNRNNGSFFSATNTETLLETLVLGIEERSFDHNGCMRTLNKCGFEHFIPLRCPAGITFSGTFVIAGRNTCP